MAICLFIETIIAKTGKKIFAETCGVKTSSFLILRRICTQFYWCLDPACLKKVQHKNQKCENF